MKEFIPLTANELLELAAEEPQEIWGPTICTSNLVMVYGPRGVSKTRFCMRLAYTMAGTGRFLSYAVDTPRTILYIDGELGLADMRRRFRSIMDESPFSPQGYRFNVLCRDNCKGELPNLASEQGQREYLKHITAVKADVIFIDNLLSCSAPLSNRDDDVSQWRRIVPFLLELRQAKKTVILVHHSGKSGDQLGTSQRENPMHTVIFLQPPAIHRDIKGTEFFLHFTKTRDVKKCDAPSLHVELIDDEDGVPRWYWRKAGEEKANAVKKLKTQGATRREVAGTLNLTLREVAELWEDQNCGY